MSQNKISYISIICGFFSGAQLVQFLKMEFESPQKKINSTIEVRAFVGHSATLQ